MIKKLLIFAVLVGILGAGYLFFHRYNYRHPISINTPAATQASDAIFAARLPDLAGIRQPIAQWRGKVLVVNFWAPWCPPCRNEIPGFMALQKEYGAQGLQFVGIALDDKAKVQKYVDEVGINYPILISDLEAVALSHATGNKSDGIPYTVVIDRNGKIVASELAELGKEKLRNIVVPLLQNK